MDAAPTFLSRRTALQAAAITAVSTVTRAQSVAPVVKPKTRDCVWIPTAGGQFCCGIVHRPAEITDKVPAALFVHDMAGSKDQPHRALVLLADAFAAAGHIALRIDLRGRGDSEGQNIDATPARDLEDVRAALAVLQTLPDIDPRDITAVGYSYGGTLVSQLAGETTAVKRVVLWSCCPTDNKSWSPPMKEINGREVFDLAGVLLSKDFFEGLAELTPHSALRKNRQAVFMLYGTHDEVTRQDDYDTCKSELSFGDVDVKSFNIEGAEHAFTNNEFQQQAIDKTIEWLKQQA